VLKQENSSSSGPFVSAVSRSSRSASGQREYREFHTVDADTDGTLLVGMPTEAHDSTVSSSTFDQEVSHVAAAECGPSLC